LEAIQVRRMFDGVGLFADGMMIGWSLTV